MKSAAYGVKKNSLSNAQAKANAIVGSGNGIRLRTWCHSFKEFANRRTLRAPVSRGQAGAREAAGLLALFSSL
jgi:hypothetical protein